MYAIVEIAGQQFKVEKDRRIFVHRLDVEEGERMVFDRVLLVDNGGDVNVGVPVVEGAKISTQVLSHLKGDKVNVFKKKRRKGYKVKNGHRQYFSELLVEGIFFGDEIPEEILANDTTDEQPEPEVTVDEPQNEVETTDEEVATNDVEEVNDEAGDDEKGKE